MKRWQYVIAILILIWLIGFALSKLFANTPIDEDQILIIPIKGIISMSDSDSPLIASTTNVDVILTSLKKAKENKNIKAVVLEINSPGGTVVASKEVADAVKDFDKPIVALIREVGASGAYWIASSADKIVADELSITGSIGVISSYLEFSKLMEEYGITYESLVSGRYKDLGSPFKELTSEERNILQSKINKIHQVFLREVKENRNLTSTKEIETGIFLLGVEAKNLGLIDVLGNKEKAIELAKELSNIKEAKIVEFKEKRTFFDLISKFASYNSYYIGLGIGDKIISSKQDNLQINVL